MIERDDIEILPRGHAEMTGENWIATARYCVRLRGHGTEIIRHSDECKILLQGDDAEEFHGEIDNDEIDREDFDKACAKLFA